jgi:hypothetical protein
LGAIAGLYDSANTTICSSRFIQLQDNVVDMIMWVDIDNFGYRLASFISTFGYASYHCYFGFKEVIVRTLDLGLESQLVIEAGFSYWEILLYNFAWN